MLGTLTWLAIAALIGVALITVAVIIDSLRELFSTWRSAKRIDFIPIDELKKCARYDPNLKTVADALSDDDDTTGVFVETTDESVFHYKAVDKELDSDVNSHGYYAWRGSETIYERT